MEIPSRSGSTSQAADGVPPWLIFLGAGARYVSSNGTQALFVDLFDNLNAHPNPSVPDPSVYSPTRSSVPYILEKQGFSVTCVADIPDNIAPYGSS